MAYNKIANEPKIMMLTAISGVMYGATNFKAPLTIIDTATMPATITPAFIFMFIYFLSEVLLLIYYYNYNYRRKGISGQEFLATKKPVVFTQQA
jgi:hypothetical protein